MNLENLSYEQSCKSHTLEEIHQGLENGEEIWLFNSGTSGNDDVLLYPAGTHIDDIRADLEDFFFLQSGELIPFDLWDRNAPSPWILEGPFNATAAEQRWGAST